MAKDHWILALGRSLDSVWNNHFTLVMRKLWFREKERVAFLRRHSDLEALSTKLYYS